MPATTGYVSWGDNYNVTGWHALVGGVVPSQVKGEVGFDVNKFNSGGALICYNESTVDKNNESTSDKALGFRSKGIDAFYGVQLTNMTGNTLYRLQVKFLLKAIYRKGNPVPHSLNIGYAIGSNVTSINDAPGVTWSQIKNVDGKAFAISNLEARSASITTFISGIELNPGEKIFIRFEDKHTAAANSSGNEDDLAIDNVEINPAPTVFFNTIAGVLTEVATWNSSSTGNGEPSLDFTHGGQQFNVQHDAVLASALTVSGTNSKVVVKAGKTLTLNANLTATIDLEAGATLIVNSATAPSFGQIDPTSTIVYNTDAPSSASSNAVIYGNLTFDGNGNSRGFKNVMGSSNIHVKGHLVLKGKGRLDLGNRNLIIDNPNSIVADTSSFIIAMGTGKVKFKMQEGETVTIPLGTLTTTSAANTGSVKGVRYAAIKLSLKRGSGGFFNVSASDYVMSKGTGGVLLDKGVVANTWFIEKEPSTEVSNMEVTLQWTKASMTNELDLTKLHLGHFENDTWDVGPSLIATESKGIYSLTRDGFRSFSPFAGGNSLNSQQMTLPVELISFKGSRSGGAVNLTWATASEKDNDYFQVERSQDGKNFSSIGQVKGNGTSHAVLAYNFLDASAPEGTVYYRLKQVDFDGKSESSKVIAIKVNGGKSNGASLEVYPNPTFNKVSVSSAGLKGPAKVTLSQSNGRLVGQKQVSLGFDSPITFDLSSQPAGVYFLQVQTDSGKVTTRIVKQ
ncbi:hypothetical protein GCM10011405_25930 [Rufibacter glacialis]|nr:hypothetical protein GCM10011405_25930 [Rufibacter glacialis]